MTATDKVDFETVRDHIRGAVLEPGDDGYEDARTVWNARIDREPAAIIRCAGAADVIAAVDLARETGLECSVKSGGHHVSGSAISDGGLTIDLSPMNGIRVDPEERTARVQAGATWGEIDHETQAFGLAVPGGQDPNIGVAGLTLGGGVGWLSRQYGLTCDNLLAADVVTAAGELVHADEQTNPDLFWGLRGGGGNFGIVTSFEFQLHEIGPEILAGSLIYPLEDAAKVARRYRDFMTDAPRAVRPLFGIMTLPAASYYPEAVHDTRVAILILFYGGDPETGKRVLAPLREFGDPVMDSVRRRSYVDWQGVGESAKVARTHVKSQYLDDLADEAIEEILSQASSAPSAGATVFISPRGGAETDPSTDATAYPHREESHHLLIEARWTDPDRDEEHIQWTNEFHEAIGPYTTGRAAMNFLTQEASTERVAAAYGANRDRLVAVKNEWDPENLFRSNQNIEPTV